MENAVAIYVPDTVLFSYNFYTTKRNKGTQKKIRKKGTKGGLIAVV